MKGFLFDIRQIDLPGGEIRTLVIFKGCSLRCPWCVNPELQRFSFASSYATIHYITPQELIVKLRQGAASYKLAGGGVTLAGGEVLCQARFALEILKKLQKLGVNTAVETSGQVNTADLLALSYYTDTIYFDLKMMDEVQARQILAADMVLIKNNLTALVRAHRPVILRISLIPGFTFYQENITAIMEFARQLKLEKAELHFSPCHGRNQPETGRVHNKAIQVTKVQLERAGLQVKIAGM